MEKRRKPGLDFGCGWANAGKRHCEPCSCDHGYIVEKIISSRRCETCFEGMVTLCGLPEHMHPPLTLCSVEVIQIRPAHSSCSLPPTAMRMPSCSCCAPNTSGRVVIVLLCCVVDSCGCRAEGVAQIEIDDCCGPLRRGEHGANVRRGAQVDVREACFAAPCAFCLHLDICLHTVVSCCEMVSTRPCSCNACPDLPLYPPPCRPNHC